MKEWPAFDENGDLPPGIHQATLAEVIDQFWIRRLAALEGEAATVAYWQLKRDGSKRGMLR